MAREPKPIRSDIAWSTSDRITVRGKSLPDEILGHMSLAEFSFFQLLGREATPEEGRVYEAIIITLVEHGMTPSAIAARITYAGAPESLQAAVAAGLCGLGTVFVGSTEGAAKMLYEALPPGIDPGADLETIATRVATEFRAAKLIVPGIGHPIHKPVDPRAPRLFEIAAENGLAGDYCTLMQLIASESSRLSNRELPTNATGAIGAIACELGLPWKIVRGIGVMARAIGLVGHLLEESEHPMGVELWARVDDEASAHLRPT